MTVQELIEELQKLPQHMIVIVEDRRYGNLEIVDGAKFLSNSQVLITSHIPKEEYGE